MQNNNNNNIATKQDRGILSLSPLHQQDPKTIRNSSGTKMPSITKGPAASTSEWSSQQSSSSKPARMLTMAQSSANFYLPSRYQQSQQGNNEDNGISASFGQSLGQLNKQLNQSNSSMLNNIQNPPTSPNITGNSKNNFSILNATQGIKKVSMTSNIPQLKQNSSNGYLSRHKQSASSLPFTNPNNNNINTNNLSLTYASQRMHQTSFSKGNTPANSSSFYNPNNLLLPQEEEQGTHGMTASQSRRSSLSGSVPQKEDALLKVSFGMAEKRKDIEKLIESASIQQQQILTCEMPNPNLLLVMMGCFQEELERKYSLLPLSEATNLQRMIDIQRIFFKYVNSVVESYSEIGKQLLEKDNQINAMNNHIDIFKKTNEQCIEQMNEIQATDNETRGFAIKEKIMEQNNIGLTIYNTKLAGSVEVLLKKVSEMEGAINADVLNKEITELKLSFEQQQLRYEQILSNKEKTISMLQLSSGSLKQTNLRLEKENQQLREGIQKHSTQIASVSQQNEILSVSTVKYREQLFMLQEDVSIQQERYRETKDLLKKFQLGYKKLQEKIDRITLDKTTNIDLPDNTEYEEETRFFETVRAIYKNNPLLSKRIKAEYYGLQLTNLEKKVMSADDRPKVYQNSIQLNINTQDPSFNINHFRYYKFSYFAFVQNKYETIMRQQNSTSIYKSRRVTNLLIGTLRAILDSKWNEAMMTTEEPRMFSDFSDFTISWLSTFSIDRFSRKITLSVESSENEMGREQYLAYFYIDLMNPVLNKLWEVITFREFLSADTSSDELYFYLHCRNMLFRGPQMEFMEATFQPIHFIKYTLARQVIEMVMCRYDQANIEFMISTIYKKCVKKNNNNLIDSAIVLRLLLEYYRAEKVHRYRTIKELFFSQQGKDIKGVYALPFESFSKIFQNNYKGTSFLEQAQLYRECMTLGNGIVSPEIFFVVCTEANFFMKNLRLKMLSEIPEYDKTTLKLEPNFDVRAKMVMKFLEDCKDKLKGCFKNLQEYSISLGIETHNADITKLIDYIKDLASMNIDSTQMAGRNFPLIFSRLVQKANATAEMKMYQLSQNEEYCGESEMMEILFTRLESTLTFIADFIEGRKNKADIKKFMRLKRFQIWIRKKISRWYNILNILLLAKLQEALKP